MRRLRPILAIALAGALAVVALTWGLEHVIPPPFSGYLAIVLVGLAITEIYKRRPGPRALHLLQVYLRARARGADERAARDRLLARVVRNAAVRPGVAAQVEAAWTGRWERDRVVAGVTALLAHQGQRPDPALVGAAWDRARDRISVPGWEALPGPFVEGLRERLDGREWQHLEGLVDSYRLFQQRFFRTPSALAADPEGAVADFSRLLASLGNRMAKDQPGDAERAYRLSLRLRPDRNLAHAGLARLLDATGRSREAAQEARLALQALDEYARRAADEPPPTEDISPFRSPTSLRQALERIAGDRAPGG